MPGAVDAKAINIHMSVTGPFSAQLAQKGAQVQTFGNQANAGFAKAQTGAAKFGATASKIATGGAVAIAVGLALSAKAAITFESSFAGVKKTVDTTEEGFQRLSDGIRRLATEIPVGVNELNRITELGGQLGVQAPDLLEFTETIALIGVTTTLSTEEAATGFARLDNIMQLGQDSFDEMGSTIVDLGNNFAATEDEILNFALRVAPIGATVGLATDEVLAIATAFTSVGVRAERGGTAIQKTFIEIAEAAKTGGEELDTFARVAGVTSEEFARLAETDPAQAFSMFITGLKKVDEEGGNVFATLDSLHLGNSRVVQSLLAMANAEGVLTDALQTADEAWKDNNALTEEAEKRFETTASQLGILKNKVIDVGIAIGIELLPAINDFADGLSVVIDWLLGLNRTLLTVIGGIGGVSIALVAMNAHPVIFALTAVAAAVTFIGNQAKETAERIQGLKNVLAGTEPGREILEGILGEKDVQQLLDLGFNSKEIADAIFGEDEVYEDFARKGKLAMQGLVTEKAEFFVPGLSDELEREYFGGIERARRDAADIREAGPTEEQLEASRLERMAAARQRLIDTNRQIDVDLIGVEDPPPIFDAELTFAQLSDVRSAVDEYVSIFTEAFADVRGELLGQISAFYEFEDDFAIAWGDIVESAIRQTDALVNFNQFFLTHDVNAGVEEWLRANIKTAQQMETFVEDFAADPAAMWMHMRAIQTGVIDRIDDLAVEIVRRKLPELEAMSGEELLGSLAAIAAKVAEDDSYNPLQAWKAVIEATEQELGAKKFAVFSGALEDALKDPAFLEGMELSISEAQILIDLLDELNGKNVVSTVEFRFAGEGLVGGRPVPGGLGGLRKPEPGDVGKNAFGGTVMAGEPTWVGELGKELFVPFSNGTIVPNSKLGSGSTNTTTVIVQDSQHRDLRTDISAGLFAASVTRQVEVLVK
jgi:TP901 family phage tail tape measure protein